MKSEDEMKLGWVCTAKGGGGEMYWDFFWRRFCGFRFHDHPGRLAARRRTVSKAVVWHAWSFGLKRYHHENHHHQQLAAEKMMMSLDESFPTVSIRSRRRHSNLGGWKALTW